MTGCETNIAESLKWPKKTPSTMVERGAGDLSPQMGGDRVVQDEPTSQLIAKWRRILADDCGLSISLAQYPVADMRPGFNWLVPDLPDTLITGEAVHRRCHELFGVFAFDGRAQHVVAAVDLYRRPASILRLRDCRETDLRYRDIPANHPIIQEIQSITLKQRLLLEIWYWRTTGRHLDVASRTLCAGSREGGERFIPGVPVVSWFSEEDMLTVNSEYVNRSIYSCLGAREVVS